MKEIRYVSSVTCSMCNGSGVVVTRSYTKCDTSGEPLKESLRCPVCDGRGCLRIETGNSEARE